MKERTNFTSSLITHRNIIKFMYIMASVAEFNGLLDLSCPVQYYSKVGTEVHLVGRREEGAKWYLASSSEKLVATLAT